MRDLLLDIVRSSFSGREGGEELRDFGEAEWGELLDLAKKAKILPLVYSFAKRWAPGADHPVLESGYENHLRRVEGQIAAIRELSVAAEKEKLRFVLFKGIGASKLIYGQEAARQAGDIDLLVRVDDLARCDNVVRSSGFFQPDWSLGPLGKRPLQQVVQMKSRTSIPYPARRKAHDNQLAPYYSGEGRTKVEVHDGVAHAEGSLLDEMIWETVRVNLGGRSVRTPDVEHTLAILLATAFGNSEGYYACVDGELNLRDYVDLRTLAESGRVDWSKARQLVRRLELEDEAAVVCANYRDVFGQGCADLESLCGGRIRTPRYGRGFLERLFDRELCVDLAERAVRESCRRGPESGRRAGSGWVAYDNRLGFDIRFKATVLEGGVEVAWRIPRQILGEPELFGFQAAIIPSMPASYLEFLVCLELEADGCPRVSHFTSRRLIQRFAPKMAEGSLKCSWEPGSGFATARVEISYVTLGLDRAGLLEGAGVIPTVFMACTRTSYHSIRGSEAEFLNPGELVIP